MSPKSKKKPGRGKGDKGISSVMPEKEISKSDEIFEAIGTIDELSSALGLASSIAIKDTIPGKEPLVELIKSIQRNLYLLSADIVSNKENINEQKIKDIEKAINELENELPTLNKFIITGGCPTASVLHMARAIARRAERSLVRLKEKKVTDNEKINNNRKINTNNDNIIIYLNRLSDLLFLMARKTNYIRKVKEETLY